MTKPRRALARPAEPEGRRALGWQAVLLLLLAGYLAAFSFANFVGFCRFMDPDIYSDTLVARYMWEQKTLFPEGWVFGNQYYVIATPVVAALFYGLTGSMNLAMGLATTVMTLAILAAAWWLFRSFLDRTSALAGLLALVSCVLTMKPDYKSEGQLFFLMASYYSCYLLTMLIVWGDYLQGLFLDKPLRCLSFPLGLALSFGTGMQSIRQTGAMVLPLLALEGLRVVWMLMGRTRQSWQPTVRAVGAAAANGAGLVLIRALHVPSVSIYGSLSLLEPGQIPERLANLKEAVRMMVGFWYWDKLGPRWFLELFTWATVLLAGAGVCLTVFHLCRRRAGPLDVLILLCIISLAGTFACLALFTIASRSVYFFVWYLLLCASALSLLQACRVKQAALLLLCLFSVLNLRYSHWPNVEDSLFPTKRIAVAVGMETAEVLEGMDCEILYGPFQMASLTCALTDGQVLCSPWYLEPLEPLGYIFPQDLHRPEDNRRAAYLVLDSELETVRQRAGELGAELTLLRQMEGMALYTSSLQLMEQP